MRDIQFPGRSTVHGTEGIVATSHPLASQTAVDILKAGGNAVDAAVAASAVLCVVEPMSTGIGGDCFALYAPGGSGDVIGLNGSGRAPQALNADVLLSQGITEIPSDNVHAVTIPGAVDAWFRLMEDHGTFDPARVLAPAIHYAEEGYAVSPIVSLYWRGLLKHINRTPGGVKHWTSKGSAPEVGERFCTPGLAQTLRAIATQGRAGFYQGDVAQDMISALREWGGLHTLEDFANTRADYVTPISNMFEGRKVLEIPPNGQGITALIMLNILSRFDLPSYGPVSAERIHLEMEAQRLAFELRDRFVADSLFSDVPVEEMLSDATADRLAARIDVNKAMEDVSDAVSDVDRDTIYLTVIDKDCNTISFINSVYMGFGSGLVAPESAVTFQNRGAGFVVEPGHRNCVEGGKRPKHTIIPGMLVHNDGSHLGKVAGAFGVMGGDYQPVGHAHVLVNMLIYDMDCQEALDCPRAFYMNGKVFVERGMPEETKEGMRARCHKVADAALPWGGGQIAMIDWNRGTFCAGSESRKDGCALAF